jgi:hypothetical protein
MPSKRRLRTCYLILCVSLALSRADLTGTSWKLSAGAFTLFSRALTMAAASVFVLQGGRETWPESCGHGCPSEKQSPVNLLQARGVLPQHYWRTALLRYCVRRGCCCVAGSAAGSERGFGLVLQSAFAFDKPVSDGMLDVQYSYRCARARCIASLLTSRVGRAALGWALHAVRSRGRYYELAGGLCHGVPVIRMPDTSTHYLRVLAMPLADWPGALLKADETCVCTRARVCLRLCGRVCVRACACACVCAWVSVRARACVGV